MKEKIEINTLNDHSTSPENIELASFCPYCGIAVHPDVLYGSCIAHDFEDENLIFLLNFCSHCKECFISKHVFDSETEEGYLFSSSAPIQSVDCKFSSKIEELSPDFVSIYKDSYIAECSGLTSICGMGYRKALEFLIKDYAIHKNSQANERDKIIQSPLMNCIKNYIQDERLVALAKASTWLGNDETHYIKKHPSYTLSNLKTFINAFLTFIDADLAYEDAQELLDS